MPARLDLSPEEMVKRVRDQTRVRTAQWRARAKGDATAGDATNKGSVTTTPGKRPRDVTPSQTLPGPPASSTKTPPLAERLAERATRFAPPPGDPRRQAPDAAWFRGRLAKYPHLDLDDLVDNALDWLATEGKGKRFATVRFFNRWFADEEAKRLARRAASTNGTTNGVYHAPATQQRNPNPEAALPLWDDDQARRSDAARERVKEFLPANLRGRWHR
jgi:hypothetical protein